MTNEGSQQTELIQLGYEALNRGDIPFVLASLSTDVEWSGYTHLPESGALKGRDAVQDWLTKFLDAFESFRVEIIELIEEDDRVIALVKFHGRGSGSGVDVAGGTDVHEWTLKDGQVTSVKLRQGTREALEEIGLHPTGGT